MSYEIKDIEDACSYYGVGKVLDDDKINYKNINHQPLAIAFLEASMAMDKIKIILSEYRIYKKQQKINGIKTQ